MPKAVFNFIADPRSESYVSEETGEVVTSRDQWQVSREGASEGGREGGREGEDRWKNGRNAEMNERKRQRLGEWQTGRGGWETKRQIKTERKRQTRERENKREEGKWRDEERDTRTLLQDAAHGTSITMQVWRGAPRHEALIQVQMPLDSETRITFNVALPESLPFCKRNYCRRVRNYCGRSFRLILDCQYRVH